MSRSSNLKKVLMTAGAVAAVGSTAMVGTFAGFTDQESIDGNSFSAGKVDVSFKGLDGTATGKVLTLQNMAIGDSVDGQMTIGNENDTKAALTLTPSATGDLAAGTAGNTDEYSDQLEINIAGVTSGITGNVGGWVSVEDYLNAGPQSLGNFTRLGQPNALKSYDVDVRLVSIDGGDTFPSLDNSLVDKNGTLGFKIDALQRSGVDRPSGSDVADNG